jgi:hypothetical protein
MEENVYDINKRGIPIIHKTDFLQDVLQIRKRMKSPTGGKVQ